MKRVEWERAEDGTDKRIMAASREYHFWFVTNLSREDIYISLKEML